MTKLPNTFDEWLVGHPDHAQGGQIIQCLLSTLTIEAFGQQCTSPYRSHLEIYDLWSGEILLASQSTTGSLPLRSVISQSGSKNRRVDDDHYERASRSSRTTLAA